MRLIFTSIMTLFLLTACGTAAPQVTVTSQVTVTLTPAPTASATPTVTFTPTPAFSPEVDMIIVDETTLKEVGAFLTAAKEAGYSAELNADDTIKMEGDLNIDPLTGKTKTSHPLTLDGGRVIQVPTTGQVGVDVTIKTDSEGNTRIYTPAWQYSKNSENGEGAWVRETIVRKSDNMETGIPKYTREEMMAAVLSENEWLEKTGQMGEESVARLWDKQRGLEMVRQGMGNGSRVGVVSNDIEFPSESKFYFDNEMYLTKDGKWLEDVATTFHVRTYLPEQDVTIVRWAGEGENGEMVVKEMMVDGDWVDPNFFKENNMSFFNFEKGSEFDLTFSQQ